MSKEREPASGALLVALRAPPAMHRLLRFSGNETAESRWTSYSLSLQFTPNPR